MRVYFNLVRPKSAIEDVHGVESVIIPMPARKRCKRLVS